MNIFIWRESLYNNDFCCDNCGAKLWYGEPHDPLVLVSTDCGNESPIFCPNCFNLVGMVKMGLPGGDVSGFQGKWEGRLFANPKKARKTVKTMKKLSKKIKSEAENEQ